MPSFCRICEAQCGTLVDVEDGRVLGIRGDPEHPSSRGLMCPKGSLIADVTHDPDRLLHPLRGDRRGGFVQVTWDEALDDIAARVGAIVEQSGPDAVAYYSGNPMAFALTGHTWSKKFLDSIGSSGSYSAAPQDTSSRWAASHFLYGNALTVPFPDLDHTDLLLCFGANPLVSHGSLMSSGRVREQLAEIVERGGRVVVIDPARTATAAAYEHVSVAPGGDALLLAAMIQVLVAEDLVDPRAAELVTGLDELAAAVAPLTPEAVADRTGVDPAVVRGLARDMARARAAAGYGRLGLCRGRFATVANYLLDALNALTGNLDARGGMIFGSGLVDLPMLYARQGRSSYTPAATRVGGLPIVAGRRPWLLAEEILTPGAGQVRAVFTVAGSPVSSGPGAARLRTAFDQLDLLVSVDLYVTESNEHADYVLPTPTFLEREDVLLNWGGQMARPWVQWTDAVIPPIGDTRGEAWIFEQLMQRMGRPPGPSPWEYVDSLIRSTDRGRAQGWTLARIKEHPHGVELGGEAPVGVVRERIRAFTDGRRDQVDIGVPQVLAEVAALLDDPPLRPGELRLIGRRQLRSINSWLHNVRDVRPDSGPFLYINPADAAARGLRSGGVAVLGTGIGRAQVAVMITDDVRPGTVSYPHGWGHSGRWRTANAHGGININELIPNDLATKDRLSGMSFVDGVPVTVEAVGSVELPVVETIS